MVYDAETTARNAEADQANDPGMCLQQCRTWAGIPALYDDATSAWEHTEDRHPGDLDPPRGAMAYWTGGSSGHGHIACSLGSGKIRSTDAGGPGRVATVPISWVAQTWGLSYAGWSWEINGKTIRHEEEEEDVDYDKIRDIVADELRKNNKPASETVWGRMQDVTTPNGDKVSKSMKQIARETWQRVAKL